jgi:predicted DnaQ family exonuclease/DinG family helicase
MSDSPLPGIIGFDSFISIDIETTGLDPRSSEIIELGAARFADGAQVESFSELVSPSAPLPLEITRLTGITKEMVGQAQAIEKVIEQYLSLIESAPWVVGHNVDFDLSFLKKYLTKKKHATIEAKALDTAVLSRILFPRLSRYNLASLVSRFDIKRTHAHRAFDDARATAEIYLKLISHLSAMSQSAKDGIGRLLFGADAAETFRQAIANVPPKVHMPAVVAEISAQEAGESDSIYPDNVVGESPEKKYEDYIHVESSAVENFFLPGGFLAKCIPAYEYRRQQSAMAMKVADAFNRSQFLLCEAPTGVGKSLAYLLPASWWGSLNNERIVISTQTKSLQSQLFYKDLPQMQKAVNYKFKATLLKGKGNYICLHKYHELAAEAEFTFGKHEREALATLSMWVKNTKTGDIAECNGFNPSQNHFIWNRVSCEGSFCLGQGCTFADRCFLLKVRREAQASQIVVTNHHLTFADFASGGELALGSGNVIFDEAHNLEKVAASFLGNALDKRNIDGILADMYSSRPTQSGFLLNLKLALSYGSYAEEQLKLVDGAIDAVTSLNYTTSHFFEKLAEHIASLPGSSVGNDSYRDAREIPYTAANNPCDIDEAAEFISSLDRLLEYLESLTDEIRDAEKIAKRREAAVRLESFLSDLKALKSVAADLLTADNAEYVYWIEKGSSPRSQSAKWRATPPRLLSAPLEVGRLLDKKLYDHLKTAIFTSATLSINKNFDYIAQRLGLDLGSKDRVATLCLDSPFDIDNEVTVVSAPFLPSPKAPNFESAANDALREILCSSARKSMVLFTSHRSLQNSAEGLREHLGKAGIELFMQEGSFSSERIFRRFKASRRAVLFGTDTFWEGVDLPGELLELLVLFKLPFTVPDRPWFKANLERIERDGENSFARLSLPDAVVKFRQGFGRLIRTASDRGVVVVLDSRVETTSFGRTFLSAVGGKKIRARTSADIAKVIREWLGG